jgi:hypothetical protein
MSSRTVCTLRLCLAFGIAHIMGLNTSSVPTYCIDKNVQLIFQPRIDNCLGSHSPSDELNYLHQHSVSYYQAGQELVAYEYFTNTHNPLRRECGKGADLEYIPLLPLAWKVGFPTHTSCTAGGVCPRHALTHPHCDITTLVQDILTYVKYTRSKANRHSEEKAMLPFVVTGALNVKSVLAHGMPTQNRRGPAWNDVMWFVGTPIMYVTNYNN